MTKAERLRDVAKNRLVRLERRAQKIGEHLKRKPGDLQAMHHLLHQIEVEYHDVSRNLKDPDWVPKPKRKREKRNIESTDHIPPPTKGDPGVPKHYSIPKPVPLPVDRIPEDQLKMGWKSSGRSWCSPPFVEVALPPGKEHVVIDHLSKFKIDDDREVVRAWAEKEFGSIAVAKEALKVGATLSVDAGVWRGLIEQAGKSERFSDLTGEELLADASARRIAMAWHQFEWVKQTAKSITDSAPKGVSKDALASKTRAHLKSFHTAVNSFKQVTNKETGAVELVNKHTNPQFSYLSMEKPVVDADTVSEQVVDWLSLPVDERFTKDENDPKKRGRITVLQKELGAAKRSKHWRGREQTQPWAGKPHWKGTLIRKRDALLIYDCCKNGLALVLCTGGGVRVDVESLLNMDGTDLRSDRQLLTPNGTGKSAFVLPLVPKHDFHRWYAKHVENDNADAPLTKRCIHNTTQFVVIPEHKGHPPQLFIRPVLKFYDPGKEIPDTHAWGAKPQCRYLIGVDRGINSPYFAAVYDTERNAIVAIRQGRGRKDEWKNLRNELALAQREHNELRNKRGKAKQLAKAMANIRALRKKERGLNKVETVESIAELANWAEKELGACNYCFVIEELQQMNLRRNNRVKNIAAIKDALVNQMRKKGYKYKEKSGKVDGVREESPWHTSAVSPFGWWAKSEDVDKDKRFIGRRVGGHYCRDAEDGRYIRGMYKKPGGKYGRKVFTLSEDDLRTGIRRRSFGSELFWDPHRTEFRGKPFPNGVVLNADFVGAFNIAVRPVVKDGKGKGFTAKNMAEVHTEFNPTVAIECEIPLYEFTEVDGDPLGALREVVV